MRPTGHEYDWNMGIWYGAIQKWWYWYPPTIPNMMILFPCGPASFRGHHLWTWHLYETTSTLPMLQMNIGPLWICFFIAAMMAAKHLSPMKPWCWNFLLIGRPWLMVPHTRAWPPGFMDILVTGKTLHIPFPWWVVCSHGKDSYNQANCIN